MEVVLGVDLGTSSAKAVALARDGRVLARASSSYPTHAEAGGIVEHDPEDWWRAACEAIRRCIAACGEHVDPAGLAFSGHMSAVAPLDREGVPLRRALTIADARGADEVADLQARHGPALAEATGNTALAAFTLPKLLWLRRHEPEVVRQVACMLGAKDYLRYRATGTIGTEPTEAGNTLLLDVQSRRWNHGLAEALELPIAALPPLAESLEIVGVVTPHAASDLGLPAGLPVLAGLADMAASVLGCGLTQRDQIAITLGTAAQITQLVDAPAPELIGRFTYHPHAIPGVQYVMASILTGGLALQWFVETLASLTGEDHDESLRRAVDAAAESPRGARGVLFLPYLVGSGSPDFDADRTAAFLGLTRAHAAGDLTRAVLEGVAYTVRLCLTHLARWHGAPQQVRLGGGGAREHLWRVILSEVTGRSLSPLADPDAGPVGAAMAVGHAVGWWPDLGAHAAALVQVGAPHRPGLQATEAYDAMYARFEREV